MKKENIMQIGDLPDGAIDHFEHICNAMNDLFEEVLVDTRCQDMQIFLNAIQYAYVRYLSAYLTVVNRCEESNIEEYVEVMRKNIISRIQCLKEEKTPGI